MKDKAGKLTNIKILTMLFTIITHHKQKRQMKTFTIKKTGALNIQRKGHDRNEHSARGRLSTEYRMTPSN